VLDGIGITTNKQVIPDDPRPPMRPSGLRIGTPAITTRGMKEPDMPPIAAWVVDALRHPDHSSRLSDEVKARVASFPVPGCVR
jgi:glycine hydroxymethyltransferase